MLASVPPAERPSGVCDRSSGCMGADVILCGDDEQTGFARTVHSAGGRGLALAMRIESL